MPPQVATPAMEVPPHPEERRVPEYYQRMPHLRPRPEVRVRLTSGSLEVHHHKQLLGAMPLNLGAVHALFDALDPRLLVQGMSLHMPLKALRTPVGFEALMQAVMINMVHCIFHRSNHTTPLRMNMKLQSLDAEINNIRNTGCINAMNHVQVLAGRLKGLPLCVALPGPSLDAEYLRANRDRFILLAGGRAAGKLLEAGVEPDVIYMQDVNAKAWDLSFASLGDRKVSSILVANPQGKIYKYFNNFSRVIKAWNLYPFEQDLFPKLEEIAPSTVSGAYSTARLLGGGPLLFLGNDCGKNTAPPKDQRPPLDQTNVQYEVLGQDLLFDTTERKQDLFLRFADEFSITTRNDYVAGAQWLKMRVNRDAAQHGARVFDRSSTGFCRFNSVIQDGADMAFHDTHALPELPRYATTYDPEPLLRQKERAYAFIRKHVGQGRMPASALKRPCSCILQGTEMARHDNPEPMGKDLDTIMANLDTVREHIEKALSALGKTPEKR